MCCGRRSRVIVFDKITILSPERASYCTNTLCFDEVSKYFCMERFWALCKSHRVLKNRVEATWSFFLTLRNNSCRTDLVPRQSKHADDMVTWSLKKKSSLLMFVSVLLLQQVSLYILQCNRCGRVGFPQSFLSRIGLFHSRSLPKNRFHQQIRIRSWSRFRNGHDDDSPAPPNAGPIFFFPRIQPFYLGCCAVWR